MGNLKQSNLRLLLSKNSTSNHRDKDFEIVSLSNILIQEIIGGNVNAGCYNSGCDGTINYACENSGCTNHRDDACKMQ